LSAGTRRYAEMSVSPMSTFFLTKRKIRLVGRRWNPLKSTFLIRRSATSREFNLWSFFVDLVSISCPLEMSCLLRLTVISSGVSLCCSIVTSGRRTCARSLIRSRWWLLLALFACFAYNVSSQPSQILASALRPTRHWLCVTASQFLGR
jgi:hypothetical protein